MFQDQDMLPLSHWYAKDCSVTDSSDSRFEFEVVFSPTAKHPLYVHFTMLTLASSFNNMFMTPDRSQIWLPLDRAGLAVSACFISRYANPG